MRGYVCCAAIVVSLFAVTSDAQAVLITCDSYGTLFYDNFEGLSGDDVSHANYATSTGDFDPAAVTGSWAVDDVADADIQVTDWSSPGPAEGDNYLRLNRSSTFAPAYANLSQALTLADDAGETLHAETMFRMESTTGNVAPLALCDGGALKAHLVVHGNGTVENWTTSGNTTLEDLDFAPNAWVKLELDYVIGADTYSFTIDGTTQEGVALYDGAGGGVSRIRISGASGGGTYYDATAIPEPTYITFLLSGVLGLFVARRRLAWSR